jgi:hypothetical protein
MLEHSFIMKSCDCAVEEVAALAVKNAMAATPRHPLGMKCPIIFRCTLSAKGLSCSLKTLLPQLPQRLPNGPLGLGAGLRVGIDPRVPSFECSVGFCQTTDIAEEDDTLQLCETSRKRSFIRSSGGQRQGRLRLTGNG